jgi:SNF2 family DNA or RNA helicase
VGEALRVAYASDVRDTGIPVLGLEATGWVASLMNAEAAYKTLTPVEAPSNFHGTLRPYQLRGLSWLAFLERMGLSMCLADDMGLGKTVQLLALLSLERERARAEAGLPPDTPAPVKPTLLVVPMSVVGNWIHETQRFCPDLRVLVHHGAERLVGETFLSRAAQSDLVITTYTLAHRDRELIQQAEWGRIVLDEAQYIKNPVAKQSQAVRNIRSEKRVALTGTPVENRLSELWSIMDFLNPGYLGSAGGFRARFAVPVERYKDRARAEQLKGLVRPFILRRLKSDPTVVADLPAKVETREFAPLTPEQAELYETCVACSPRLRTPRGSSVAGWCSPGSSASSRSATIRVNSSRTGPAIRASPPSPVARASASASSKSSRKCSPRGIRPSSSRSSARWAGFSPP